VTELDDMGAGAEEALGLGIRLALLEARVGHTEDQGSNSKKECHQSIFSLIDIAVWRAGMMAQLQKAVTTS
jgi:hypothetical protein